MTTNNPRNSRERGVVLVLVVILIIGIISIFGLVVDLGRFEYTIRQMQNAADAASLAAVNQFRNCPLGYTDQLSWQNAKKAVPAVLSTVKIHELDSDAYSLFNDGNTPHFQYDDETTPNTFHEDILGSTNYTRIAGYAENLRVSVERGIACIDDIGARRWFSLDNPEVGGPTGVDHFCLANSVKVSLELSGFKTAFARIFGADIMKTLKIEATAQMEEDSWNCGDPKCHELPLNSSSGSIIWRDCTSITTCPSP